MSGRTGTAATQTPATQTPAQQTPTPHTPPPLDPPQDAPSPDALSRDAAADDALSHDALSPDALSRDALSHDTGRSAVEVLAWSRGLVDPGLRQAVDALPETMGRIAAYHFGWDEKDGRGAGKAIRPALSLLAAEAVGGTAASALPAAVAVELAHNFSLLHDDVMDEDLTRRHRATAWTVFGASAAILAGDALLAAALEVLADERYPAGTRGVRILGAAVLELVEGQSADVAFEERSDVTLPECLRMAGRKTGALLGGACALGAVYGGGTPEQVGLLRGFGERIGLAFQLVDDLLGIWGDPAVTGKPAHSDLHNRKKSLPVVAALTSDTPAGRELSALYLRDRPLAGDEPARAAALIEIAGGRSWALRRADELLASALSRLEAAGPAPGAAGELRTMARLITRRDH